MGSPVKKRYILVRVIAVITAVFAMTVGVGLGWAIAETANIKNTENFFELAPALPSRLVAMDGTVITEYSSEEKRELVSLNDMPKHLIHAVLVREDPNFFKHKGFSVRGIIRAAIGRLRKQNLGGGSTITQQVAGTLYADRTEITITRKIKELWWALQMERRYTKNEILEIYLNYMNMGPGTYGVEAASKYFFGHPAKDVTVAEAAILAILFSNPSGYNPLNHPNVAMERQQILLDRMVELGYTTKEEAETSFQDYWNSFDYTREVTSAYYMREDKAPWFSEYVRRELDSELYGAMDYNRDGYTVHTTLDLDFQDLATKYMEQRIRYANRVYEGDAGSRVARARNTYVPILNLLGYTFNMNMLRTDAAARNRDRSIRKYTEVVNPVVDIAALMFGIEDLKGITNKAFEELKENTEKTQIEGALVTIENSTGYIKAIVGGSRFDEGNQYIRATQGRLMPGSAFKPLYYSAAIDSKMFTAGSLIYDIPMVFYDEVGNPYIPQNYSGEFSGPVTLYNALALSLNVPSLKILDGIGFDAAINRSAALLGITDPEEKRRTFPRVYPMGLGIISLSPLQLARAFAIFGNEGRDVEPIAITTIEDRNGRVVLDLERDTRAAQRRAGEAVQIVSPQNAYIMTSILKKTVELGTLYAGTEGGRKFIFKDKDGKSFRMPVAGKTGTTQNWSDAWSVGYTPYYTTAMWFGFDRPGNSLGMGFTGAGLAGPIWADYMVDIHKGLPYKDFVRPEHGVVDVTVCSKTGLLRTPACGGYAVTLPYLTGTAPTSYCAYHRGGAYRGERIEALGDLNSGIYSEGVQSFINNLPGLKLPDMDDLPMRRSTGTPSTTSGQSGESGGLLDYNPLLD
jgi:penicillin-binding protein 1A